MRNNRRLLLDLVAAGRIAPAEAERLLAEWNEGRESLWIVALCGIAVCFMQAPLHADLSALLHLTHGWAPGHSIHHGITHGITLLTQTLGGMR